MTFFRKLLDAMQAGTLEPEVAFLNASIVSNLLISSCIIN